MIDIIVPVWQRPQAAAPFMAWLRSTEGEYNVWPVVSPRDVKTAQAWLVQGVDPLVSKRGDRFAQKAQYAYEHTTAPWMLLVGDDVKFHQRWWWAFLDAINGTVAMIAPNDMHNPYVMNGTHANHPFILRQWVDECGASWDGPGHIAHAGYHHAYVDAEWSARAIEDDVFVYAPECRIEHMHPTWGLADRDDTYRKGMRHYDRDRRLFEHRQMLHQEGQL